MGDAYDNALIEPINGVYMPEYIRTTVFNEGPYKTIVGARFDTCGWAD